MGVVKRGECGDQERVCHGCDQERNVEEGVSGVWLVIQGVDVDDAWLSGLL